MSSDERGGDARSTVPLPFADLQDSPIFRARCTEVEAAADSLRGRTKKLVSGAQQYADSLEEACQESLRFASCLETFCSGDDDESMFTGGPTIIRFVQTIRELSSFLELLKTQVELILCDRLSQRSAVMTTDIREARKRLNQRSSDYDTARSRYLGHRSLAQRGPWANGKQASPERNQQTMMAARSAADEARFDLARKLVEAQSQVKYEFLEAAASIMQAHLKYYDHGFKVVDSMNPYIQETLEFASRLKTEAGRKQEALEEMIHAQRAADQARESAVWAADAASMGDALFLGGGGGSSVGDVSPSLTATSSGVLPSPGSSAQTPPPSYSTTAMATSTSYNNSTLGPVQMSAATTALASELEHYLRATHASGGQQVTVLRQGWLLKQSSNFKSKWQRRFFVLDSTGILYYYSSKAGERASLGGTRDQRPHATVNLLTATVKAGAAPIAKGDPPLPFAFRLVSPEREYTLQAEDEVEMKGWMETLQGVIACLLSGVIELDVGRELTLPTRPTHTRDISIDLSSSSGAAAAAAAATAAAGMIGGGGGMASPSSSTDTNPPPIGGGGGGGDVSRSILPPTPTPLSPSQLLSTVPGNTICADCGAPNPDWGSLNLGTLHCIECSGFHRKLGVHMSKIRSLTLDVRAWDENVLAVFQNVGNEVANGVWEATLTLTRRAGAGGSGSGRGVVSRPLPDALLESSPQKGEDWVWRDGSDDEDEDGVVKKEATHEEQVNKLTAALHSMGASSSSKSPKPMISSSSAAKESFIVSKYAKKEFMVALGGRLPPPSELRKNVWAAVIAKDIPTIYRMLAYGADVSTVFSTSEAAHLVEDTQTMAGGAMERILSVRGLGEVTITHAAAVVGDPVVMELLLQWGAPVDCQDGYHRTALMYAVLHDKAEVAKQLLRRGASVGVHDVMGHSVMQLAGQRCLGDADVVALLSA